MSKKVDDKEAIINLAITYANAFEAMDYILHGNHIVTFKKFLNEDLKKTENKRYRFKAMSTTFLDGVSGAKEFYADSSKELLIQLAEHKEYLFSDDYCVVQLMEDMICIDSNGNRCNLEQSIERQKKEMEAFLLKEKKCLSLKAQVWNYLKNDMLSLPKRLGRKLVSVWRDRFR